MNKLSDRQDIIGYLSWCEATNTSPFDEDEDDKQINIVDEEEKTEIEPDQIKLLKRKNVKKRKDD